MSTLDLPLSTPAGCDEPCLDAAATATARRTWSRRTSFWVVISAQALLLAASNFPTPLFPTYEHRYGFSSSTVTMLFAVYVLALVPTLLTLGRFADKVGRRPVLLAGIAVTIASSLVFASARNVGWLFAGEVSYGIGGGLVMSCVAVAIRELHPKQDTAGGALAATLSAAAGLALGPLVSGLLATVTPWPTVAPYALHVVLAVVLVGALSRIPETRPDVAPPRHRVPVLHVPAEIRSAFVATALAGATGWMLLGWVFGLSPSFLHEELGVHITQPVVAGLFAALAVVANGSAQLASRRSDSATALRLALGLVVVGMALMAGSTLVGSLAVAIVGAVVAGAGAGISQRHTMATVQRIAPVHARGGVTSAYLTGCYVAMSLPVVVAGVIADRIGLGTVTAWYLAALALLVVAALVAEARRAGPAEDRTASLAALAGDEPIVPGAVDPALVATGPLDAQP
ncbi:MFS transporter [Aquihabitans sp. G128]|uniref:MFS transporter n=1 Tax=Aquihabitans sp. G128 TaxID=2849779 RepID=UPI001C215191|nr:MFS transporter [Aquihabitans sp. G128]QXC59223.1 MFS transporter [Aquihabitans sp. G128]